MQDLVVDKLVSKRIAVAADALVGKPTRAIARATPATKVEFDRVYTGPMVISGTMSANNGQKGTWTGTLKTKLYATVDASGNGTGYETFSGNITLHSNGKSDTEPLIFSTPVFSLHGGKFNYPSGGFSYGLLSFHLDVKGSFKGTQQTISEHLSLPFSGYVNGVSVSGSMTGDSSIKTPPLALSGASSPYSYYAGTKVRPLENIVISDLSGTTVKATVKMSHATDGTLSNLAGGTYNKATGVYTVSGTEAVVQRTIRGLTFVAAADLASSDKKARTGFLLSVTDGAGAVRTLQTHALTSDPLAIAGAVAHQKTDGTTAIALFQRVGIYDQRIHAETLTITLSDPSNGTLENLSGGHYNATTGVYVLQGNRGQLTRQIKKSGICPHEIVEFGHRDRVHDHRGKFHRSDGHRFDHDGHRQGSGGRCNGKDRRGAVQTIYRPRPAWRARPCVGSIVPPRSAGPSAFRDNRQP